MRITRLAPSPTGALHLGNARTFLANWLLARQAGWKVILRIEDLDGPRIKSGADRQAIDDLQWLGLDWDEGPIYQSSRMPVYQRWIDRLLADGRAYFCTCSRKEVESAAGAPHAEDGSVRYPGICRDRFASREEALADSGRLPAIRFRSPGGIVEFEDAIGGLHRYDADELGDFVIAKADGTAAYQLAVVVDDAEMGVSDVVRGDDLRESAPRQILLYQAMNHADRIPRYCHLPLVVGPDGRRLAKRHGDTRLGYYREQGVNPSRLAAMLGRWCGIATGDAVSPAELIGRFRLEQFPGTAMVFTAAEDRWLRG